MENLILADTIARKGKAKSYGIVAHDKFRAQNLLQLQTDLKNGTFQTSPYSIFTIYKPKERDIFRLPYFPDRITHHAIMNILEPIFYKVFTADTYACIKGRGIHSAANKLKKDLASNPDATLYCLKLDIRKYYPSIDHDVLLQIIQRKIKDKAVISLLKNIIKSAPGLPIGNYLSQHLSNLYLTYFDHWIKEELRVKYYYRYADDMVLLAATKEELWAHFSEIETYLKDNLKLEIKGDYQVFPVEKRGIDFVGYVFYHTHTLLRKEIKKSFARAIKKNKPRATTASYYGWALHCNSKNLLRKLNYAI